uniref:myeloid leukemia factor 1-like n=1 Tax=Styela clava TaxID=7725 RepID=UPI001939B675|nr:myeloid leukemia factor 1-like [Styela clava]
MFPSMFGHDPFNMDPFEHMNRMMSQFHSPLFSSPLMLQRPGGMLQLEDGMRRHQLSMPVSPFEDMMGRMNGMQNMMQNAQRNMSMQSFSGGLTPGAGQSYHSSTIVMQSGQEGPRVIESTSSTRVGQDGVKETRKSHKDTGTGEMRMAIGHHIHDRAHIIEKAKNRRTGDEEEKQEYVNIEEEEADTFNNEWKQKMGAAEPKSDIQCSLTYGSYRNSSRSGPYDPQQRPRMGQRRFPRAAITQGEVLDDLRERSGRRDRQHGRPLFSIRHGRPPFETRHGRPSLETRQGHPPFETRRGHPPSSSGHDDR